MNVRWEDLQTILALVRHGSLQGAADSLAVNYTTVARRVTRAEEDFGETLFERLATGYQANEQARLMAQFAERMEEESIALGRELAGQDATLRGPLTITAPQLLVATHLARVVRDFCEEYPEVELLVRGSNALLDLNRKEADLAIRVTNTPDESLVGKRLTKQHAAAFATAALGRKITKKTAAVPWLAHESAPAVPKESLVLYPGGYVRARFDETSAMIGAARIGLGVVKLPLFLGRSTTGLVQVPVLPPQPYPDIWMVSHRDMRNAAKVRAFKEILIQYFVQHRDQFVA